MESYDIDDTIKDLMSDLLGDDDNLMAEVEEIMNTEETCNECIDDGNCSDVKCPFYFHQLKYTGE